MIMKRFDKRKLKRYRQAKSWRVRYDCFRDSVMGRASFRRIFGNYSRGIIYMNAPKQTVICSQVVPFPEAGVRIGFELSGREEP